MRRREAQRIIEERLRAGAKLVVAQEAEWSSIKRLQAKCHEGGIPAVLVPCPAGG